MKSTEIDRHWMRRALALAQRGTGRVHPNPLVGCVVVKNGKFIAGGFHRRYGGNHAEVEALKRAGQRARGSTVYLNLEPCSHWGKTPPCVDALLHAGVRRVVFAMIDPNPHVSGRGARRLKQHGVSITRGVLEADAQELNRAFSVWVREHRPYVTLKVAASLDGKIATAGGESQWITGSAARRMGHALRVQADAIAVGIGTALTDNPELTAHGRGRDPIRVLFDSRLRIPLKAKLLRSRASRIIFTTSLSSVQKRRGLGKLGVQVHRVAHDRHGHTSVREALRVLAHQGVAHLLVEGGGTLHASFLEAGVVDEIIWFLAPMILGGATAKSAVGGVGVQRLQNAWRLKDLKVECVGQDLCIRGKLR